MSMEKEDCQIIDAVYALQDVMEIVFKYLDIRDVMSVSEVCKSWQEAASRELGKRTHITHFRLLYKKRIIRSLTNKLQKWQMEPYVSLFFVNERLGTKKKDLLEELKEKLPNKTVLFRVDKCFTTHGTECGGKTEQRDVELLTPFIYCDILGLFLPNDAQQQINIRATCMPEKVAVESWDCIPEPELDGAYHEKVLCDDGRIRALPCAADRVAKELGLDDCKYPKSTILFVGSAGHLTDCIFEVYKREQQNGKEVTLAFLLGHEGIQHADNCPNENHERNSLLAWCRQRLQSKKQEKLFSSRIVLRISGPSVESWSTFIFMYATSDEIDRKLHQLKKKVKRKRHITGLFYAPYCNDSEMCNGHLNHPCGNSDEMISRVKRIFPDIPFAGSFKRSPYSYYETKNRMRKDEFDENDVTTFLEELTEELPNKTVLFTVDKCFTTHDTEYGGEMEQSDVEMTTSDYCDILGLFLPNAQQRITIRAAYISDEKVVIEPWEWVPELGELYHEKHLCADGRVKAVPCAADRVAKELGLDDCPYPKSTLLFVGSVEHVSDCIAEVCKREQQNGKEVTSAFCLGREGIQHADIANNYPNENHERNSLLTWCRQRLQSKKQEKSFSSRLVLRISGPSVESWSTFIFIFETSDEIERQLHKLKEKVIRKRYITGLLYAPYCNESEMCNGHLDHPCGNSDEMISRVKRIFPDIPFAGSFKSTPYSYYDLKNRKDDFDKHDAATCN